ncbi:hypothetical protein, partial [Methylobacterium planeticum]|uniref:hypothetical protein n=1 Tax=Methylobacterium planeticum TaxID=2615211 RepID=UPI001AEDA408
FIIENKVDMVGVTGSIPVAPTTHLSDVTGFSLTEDGLDRRKRMSPWFGEPDPGSIQAPCRFSIPGIKPSA